MSCNSKINTKEFLVNRGVIDENLMIRHIDEYRTINKLLISLAEDKYKISLPHKLAPLEIEVEGSNLKAKFNEAVFEAIDIGTEEFSSEGLNGIKKVLARIATQPTILSTAARLFSDEQVDERVDNFKGQTNIIKTPAEYLLFGEAEPAITKNPVQIYEQRFPKGSVNNVRSSQFDAALFEKEAIKEFPANVVLNNIINNYSNFTEEGAEFIQRAQELLKSNTQIVLVPTHILRETLGDRGTTMMYNSKYNKIYVSIDILNELDLSAVVSTMIHEIVHSVTVQAYEAPQTVDEQMFHDNVFEAFHHFKKYAGVIGYHNSYGLTSPLEFIAEIVSNKKFRDSLKTVDNNNYDIINKFIQWVRRLFGMKKTHDIDMLVQEIIGIYKPFDYSLELYADNAQNKSFLHQKRTKEEFLEEDLMIDDSTLEKRLLNTIQKLTISLDSSIKSLTRQVEAAVESEEDFKEQYLLEQVTILDNVKRDLSSVELVHKIQAVEAFSNIMIGNMEAIKKSLARVDIQDEKYLLNAINRFDKILAAYSIIDDVQDIIAAIETEEDYSKFISEKELFSLKNQTEMASGRYYSAKKTVEELTKKYMVKKLNHVKYFKEVETKHYNRLSKEHRESKIIEDKDQWIIKTMANRDKERIDEDVEVAVTKLINNNAWDIFAADVSASSGLNISAPLIQVMHQILTEIDGIRNRERVAKDVEFEKMFKKLREEKGTNNIKTLYENILDFDENGKAYIKGEYKASFMSEVYQKIKALRSEYAALQADSAVELNELPVNSIEYEQKRIEHQNLIIDGKNKIKALENQHTKKLDGKTRVIKESWKNNLSNLSETEKEIRDFFIATSQEIRKMTFPSEAENNIKYAYKAQFYELPKITKSDTERFFSGDIKGMAKDKVTELAKFRPDDYGYVERITDLSGRRMRALKLWYRDPSDSFDNKDQSLDLMGIMRMDYIQANAHQIRGQYEHEVKFILDIARNKDYYNKEGTVPVVSKLFNKYDINSGADSNTVKFLNNMVESKFYDILNKGSVRIGQVDANKAVTFINNASAFLTLSLNLASGTANVVNANAQLFIESFWKGRFITASSLKKANTIYSTTLGDSMRDLTRPYNRSFVNQLQEYFNSKGLFELAHADFLRTDMLKVGLNQESLRIFQESGEHYIQSITVMAVLDGIKVMDENHNFINKDGKIVKTKKAAASILDMMEVDKIDGIIKMNSNVVYTTHSKLVKWSEGGKENLDSLVAKKLYDVIGNYRPTDQPDITRAWYGKLIMLYRKFLIPMGQARLRGIESSFTRKEDLKDHEKRYSYALQEYEEGYYTTFIRYITSSIKDKKMYLMSKEKVWDKLTDYEKNNIKKAFVETVMTAVILPLVVQLLASIQGDDDDEYVFFILYQIRRMETELSQYKSPSESFKMMRSPIPSMRLLETSLSVISDSFQPWKWGDEYQGGYNKGKSKYWTKIKKQLPVIKEYQRTYKDLFEYQNSYFGFK